MILGLGTMILYATTLVVLLVIGGVKTNPGPGVKTEKITRLMQWVRQNTEIRDSV